MTPALAGRTQMRPKMRPGVVNGGSGAALGRQGSWSWQRRMRDSNSRGLAPNTLSKSVAVRPAMFTTIRDLHVAVKPVCAGRR